MSSSADGGNTWSAPKTILAQTKTDQFNPWLDVDPTEGTVHVIYYSTKNDPDRKKTDIYYVNSADGGTTWVNETKVTTMMTDETDAASNRNQYGDYNGLAVFQSFAHPVWTDRRTGTPGGNEQIYTSGIKQH
jgi:Neuraminidase (sialidase)